MNEVPVVAETPFPLPDLLINFTNSVVMTLAIMEAIAKVRKLACKVDMTLAIQVDIRGYTSELTR